MDTGECYLFALDSLGLQNRKQGIKNFYTSISVCMSVYLYLQDVHIGYNTS